MDTTIVTGWYLRFFVQSTEDIEAVVPLRAASKMCKSICDQRLCCERPAVFSAAIGVPHGDNFLSDLVSCSSAPTFMRYVNHGAVVYKALDRLIYFANLGLDRCKGCEIYSQCNVRRWGECCGKEATPASTKAIIAYTKDKISADYFADIMQFVLGFMDGLPRCHDVLVYRLCLRDSFFGDSLINSLRLCPGPTSRCLCRLDKTLHDEQHAIIARIREADPGRLKAYISRALPGYCTVKHCIGMFLDIWREMGDGKGLCEAGELVFYPPIMTAILEDDAEMLEKFASTNKRAFVMSYDIIIAFSASTARDWKLRPRCFEFLSRNYADCFGVSIFAEIQSLINTQ